MTEQIVKCNWCESTFVESDIIVDPETATERCPICNHPGHLMDIDK